MDLRTVLLMMAVGSFVFGLLLLALKAGKNSPLGVPFWFPAKILQALGSLMLFFRVDNFDFLTILANTALLLGCSYEAWAVRIMIGRSRISWRYRISVFLGIAASCSLAVLLSVPYRSGLVFLLQSAFYFLPAAFLFQKPKSSFRLRLLLASCYSLTGLVFFSNAAVCFLFPGSAMAIGRNSVFLAIPVVTFSIFVISGFILLMHAKERSDMLVQAIQKDLIKSEIRFQHIVETAIEGIIIFDGDYRISFANDNMASILGYSVGEMLGKSYASFFPGDQTEIYEQQEVFRKQGRDSVYECRLLKKDGSANWFLVSEKPIFGEKGTFEGSFAMLTDIDQRKKMELLLEESNRRLTELSNKDGLTGIANRRRFDDALQQECKRLERSNSRLSVILLDIDFFKEYNDCYGHVMGDVCLRKVGRVMERCINRSVDLAARYGGEEFACILPDTDLEGAAAIAECIRRGIEGLKIEHKKSSISKYVTASLGVATAGYFPEITPERLINKADELLYEAKMSGRNAVKKGKCS